MDRDYHDEKEFEGFNGRIKILTLKELIGLG